MVMSTSTGTVPILPYMLELIKYAFSNLSSINMTLAVWILIQNAMIIADYYKDRKKFVPAMFMLIAAADMLTAAGEMIKSVLQVD